ncbi:MAG: alpha/beta fold hydrolase [Betaproteobacteria bacterium]|nr:alpha/beta fold hydrolase [Betaproteobacteria bacterium]
MQQLPETIELETGAQPDAAVIWLHGLGADGHDFEPIVDELALPERLAIRFVFPHAPVRPVTINMGASMRAWYDIVALDGRQEDAAGIRASQQRLDGLIGREGARGVEPRRIVLAGFSQGGAIALHCGLRCPSRLAGIMALSTYLPLAGTVEVERNPANAGLPILMVHGQQDEMIGIGRARSSRSALEALGYSLEWREYPMGHSVCVEEIAAIADWLGRTL